MWPWAHLAVGYLLLTGLTRHRLGGRPAGGPTIAAAFGSVFPDLVDKPLAYEWSVLPGGRTLAHSLLVLVPLCLVVGVVARNRGSGSVGAGFAIGCLSHPAADAIGPALGGRFAEVTFLLWPLLAPPGSAITTLADYPTRLAMEVSTFLGGGLAALASPFGLQLWLTLAGAALWIRDGAPPLSVVFAPRE